MRAADHWICSHTRCRPVGARTASAVGKLFDITSAATPRVTRDTWVRYRLELDQARPPPPDIQLQLVDQAWIDRLSGMPERAQPQVRSGLRFWKLGFRRGYVWFDNDRPLGMIWLFTPEQRHLLKNLVPWGGMYPDLPDRMGFTEGLYTFPAGLRRGGAATELALAVFAQARELGLEELWTHVHMDNIAAHRWAERAGWQPFGTIERVQPQLPLLRLPPFFLHRARAVEPPTAPLRPVPRG